MTKNIPRCVVVDSKTWFPLVDITKKCKNGDKLYPSATRWLKNNISENSIRKIKFKATPTAKGGLLLAISSDSVKIVGMYEAHLASGKDFRAKWADLPDTPMLDTTTKREISWKNLYKWSKTEHLSNTGLCGKYLSELRNTASRVSNILQEDNPETNLSYNDALHLLNNN